MIDHRAIYKVIAVGPGYYNLEFLGKNNIWVTSGIHGKDTVESICKDISSKLARLFYL
jgi:hypothetical protein